MEPPLKTASLENKPNLTANAYVEKITTNAHNAAKAIGIKREKILFEVLEGG